MGILQSIFKPRDKPKNIGSNSFLWGGSSSGKVVNEHTAMQMTAVYSCVRILSETLAGLPLHVYKYNDTGGKEKYLNHPLYKLLHDEPNPEMTSFAFRETLMSHLLLWGNAYAQIIRNARNEVLSLYPLMPNKITVDRDSNGRLFYLYQRGSADVPTLGKDSQVYLAPSDVLHIPGLALTDLSGIAHLLGKKRRRTCYICHRGNMELSFFANGCRHRAVCLKHPAKPIKDPQKRQRILECRLQGSANSHRVAVLEEGMKYQPIGISPEQAQFLETRKFQINETRPDFPELPPPYARRSLKNRASAT